VLLLGFFPTLPLCYRPGKFCAVHAAGHQSKGLAMCNGQVDNKLCGRSGEGSGKSMAGSVSC
jgi:hypothetical protein